MIKRKIGLSIFLMSFFVMTVEVLLIRVFDVVMSFHAGYVIITCVLMSLGAGGIYACFFQRGAADQKSIESFVLKVNLALALIIICLRPVLNAIPFDLRLFSVAPFKQSVCFALFYFVLCLPFFISGLFYARVYAVFKSDLNTLYASNLAGAMLGVICYIPLLPVFGPGGILFFMAALCLGCCGLFEDRKNFSRLYWAGAVVLLLLPVFELPEIYEFSLHTDKRGVLRAYLEDRIEFSRWDLISKIDILRLNERRKNIAYDGGEQSSHFNKFDGDYAGLRRRLERTWKDHFWDLAILAPHYLKRGEESRVAVIGSAGGQETKAALLYGARSVDAVEMVPTVVDLGRGRYSDFIGGLFNDPRVRVHVQDGRRFVRSVQKSFDVIQIYSNYKTSLLSAGSGLFICKYLFTVEAFEEYFRHLNPAGMLHIQFVKHIQMLATAEEAWKRLGRSGFWHHVVVFGRRNNVIIKMTPWTDAEIAQLDSFLTLTSPEEGEIKFDPVRIKPGLSPVKDPPADRLETDIPRLAGLFNPVFDDRPFFGYKDYWFGAEKYFVSKNSGFLTRTKRQFRELLRYPLSTLLYLTLPFAVSAVYLILFIFLPLCFVESQLERWKSEIAFLSYFSLIGMAFIIVELVLVQLFLRFIGNPTYTYSTLLGTLFLGAATSVFLLNKCFQQKSSRSFLFFGIFGYILFFLLIYPAVFNSFHSSSLGIRILVSSLMIFPAGFFIGVPFPLGMMAVPDHQGTAVMWGWAMNSLFTVIGSLASVVLSYVFGFRLSLLFALLVYLFAFVMYRKIIGQEV